MAFAITIAGATKTVRKGSLSIPLTANGRATASFQIVSADGTYRPAIDAEVIMTEGATRIFGGLVSRPREVGAMGTGFSPGIVTHVSAVDFNVYAERRYVDETIPAGTLKAALLVLVPYLSGYGVTLDAGQVDGPTLPQLIYDFRRLDEVLNELGTMTADAGEPYVWEIDHFKVLRMFQPSTSAAPFDILDDTPAEVIGDIEVEVSRDQYANRIIVRVPPKSETERVESFTGDGVADSVTLQYTVTRHYGYVTYDGIYERLRTPDDPDFAEWTLDPADGSLTRAAGPIGSGLALSIHFDGVYEGLGIAEDAGEIAAHGIKERVVTVDAVPDDTTAQAIAEAYLARSLAERKSVTYRTHEPGVSPGQAQQITVPRRNLNAGAVITDVVISDVGTDTLQRRVTAIVDATQTNLGRGWREELMLWRGDRTGGGVSAPAVGTVSSAGPSAPDESVQTNQGGRFSGKASFLFRRDQNSIIHGLDSDITAAAYESCGTFGRNGIIEDAP